MNIPAPSAMGNKAYEVLKSQKVLTDLVTKKSNDRSGGLEISKAYKQPAIGILEYQNSLKDYRLLNRQLNSIFKIPNLTTFSRALNAIF